MLIRYIKHLSDAAFTKIKWALSLVSGISTTSLVIMLEM
jgi:hypothetical protein